MYFFIYSPIDPVVGLLHAVTQANAGGPTQVLNDLGVVAVAAIHAFGSGEVVIVLELDAGDVFDHVVETFDRGQLVGTEIDRLEDVAVGDGEDSLDAVVDVHEAAGLLAVAPDFDFRSRRSPWRE